MSSVSQAFQNGIRFVQLGTVSDLPLAAPLVDGGTAINAGTAASRIGIYFDRTVSAEKMAVVVLGTEVLAVFDDSIQALGVRSTNSTLVGDNDAAAFLGLGRYGAAQNSRIQAGYGADGTQNNTGLTLSVRNVAGTDIDALLIDPNGNVTFANPVAFGGFSANRILISNGAGVATSAPALTNGQLLIGSSGFGPVATTLTAGANVTILNTAGGITISAVGGAGSPGGADTNVQFNNAGVFGGEAAFTYNLTTNLLTAGDFLRVGGGAYSVTDAVVLVRRESVAVLSSHAFRDESVWTVAAGGGGYTSFDTAVAYAGASAFSHLHGYQARNSYTGATSLTDLVGFLSHTNHSGAGTVANAIGAWVKDPTGAGPITTNYGIKIEDLTRGTTDYAIYSGLGIVRFGGPLSLNGGGIGIPAAETLASVAGDYGTTIRNTNAGVAAYAYTTWRNDVNAVAVATAYSSGYTGLQFGIVAANYTTFGTYGADSNGLMLGSVGIDRPIIFGINNSEVGRFTSASFTTNLIAIFPATTVGAASVRLPHGTAPTTPVNGDLWSTTAGFFGRVNGVTVGPFGSGGGGVSGSGATGQITYWNGVSSVTGEAAFAYNDSTDTLTAGSIVRTGNGAVATPSYSATADTNTGIYFPAGDTVAISCGGTDSLVLSATSVTASVIGIFPATVVGAASVRLPHGTAPTTPVNGDLWSTTAGFFGRVNGVTVGPFGAGGGTVTGSGASGQITYWNGVSSVTGEAAFAYNDTTNVLTVGATRGDAGTAAAPTFSFTGDADTGIYNISANRLGIAVTGILRVTVEEDSLTSTVIGIFPASTIANASIRLLHGSAPNNPGNGDIWSTSAGFFGRVSGTTIGPFGTVRGSAVSGYVAYWDGISTITGEANFAYNSATEALTAGSVVRTGTGSSSNAAYSTVADFDTGIYFPGLDSLAITCGGVDKLVLTVTTLTSTVIGIFPATVVGAASIRLPHGTAPSAPVNGDLWSTTAGFFGRVNGVTVGPFGAGGGTVTGTGASGQITYWNGASSVTGEAAFAYDDTTNVLTVGTARVDAGTAAAPTLSFTGDTNTGIYSVGADQLGIATNGVLRVTVSTTELTSTLIGIFPATAVGAASVRLPHGTAPTAPVNGDLWSTTAGFFGRVNGVTVGPFGSGAGTVTGSGAAGQVSYWSGASAITGEAAFTYNDSTDTLTAGSIVRTGNGAAATPAYSATADTNTGMYFPGGDSVAISCGGTDILTLTAVLMTSVVNTTAPVVIASTAYHAGINGTAGAPVYSRGADTNTGMYFPGGDSVAISCGSTDILVLSTTSVTASVIGIFPAATSGAASVRLPHGTAPTAPVNGDLWSTTAGFFGRVNGVTVGPFGSGGGGVSGSGATGQITYWNGASSVTGEAAFAYDDTTNVLTVGATRVDAGSAAAPTLSFTGDTDTGIYSVGADQLGISVGGTLRATASTTALTLAGGINLAMSGASTLVTGTGAISLNGAVTANTGIAVTGGATPPGTSGALGWGNSILYLGGVGSANVASGNNAGALFFHGGSANNGGGLQIYGSTHASAPNSFRLVVGGASYLVGEASAVTLSNGISLAMSGASTLVSGTGVVTLNGATTINSTLTTTGIAVFPATVVGAASIRLPHGTAPTTPVNGDLWSTTAGFFGRVNGVTVGPFGSGGGGVSGSGATGQITYWNGASSVTGEAAFAYNDSTNILSVDSISTSFIGAGAAPTATDRIFATAASGIHAATLRNQLNGSGAALVLSSDTRSGAEAATLQLQSINRLGATAFGITVGGQVLLGAGTAAAPVLAIDGDTDTGIYSIGADQLGISVGGALRVTTSTTALTLAGGINLAMSGASTLVSGTGVVTLNGATTVTSTSGITSLQAATQDAIRILGRAGGSSAFVSTLTTPTLAGNITLTLPADTASFATLALAETLTNKTLTSPAINTATIIGGTINNTSVGATTRSSGRFTTLDAAQGTAGVISLDVTQSDAGASTIPALRVVSSASAQTTAGVLDVVLANVGAATDILIRGRAAAVNRFFVYGNGAVTATGLISGVGVSSSRSIEASGALLAASASKGTLDQLNASTSRLIAFGPDDSTAGTLQLAAASSLVNIYEIVATISSAALTLASGKNLAMSGASTLVSGTGVVTLNGATTINSTLTTTGIAVFPATVVGAASIRLPHGTAPTTPVNGDLWSTTAGFFGRVNGVTVGPFGAGGGTVTGSGAAGQVSYWSGASAITSEAAFAYDDATNVLTAGRVRLDVGTEANLSVSFSSDTDTGFFRSNVDELGIVVGGNLRLSLAPTLMTVIPRAKFNAAVNGHQFALTDAAAITTDAAVANTFTVTLTGNRSLSNPTNLVSGSTYFWEIRQDATGSRTLSYGGNFSWPGGVVPVLSTAANAVDIITAVFTGSFLRAVMNKAFA